MLNNAKSGRSSRNFYNQAYFRQMAHVRFGLERLADRHGALTHKAGTIERARQDSLTQFLLDEFGMSPIAVADAAVELIARKAARA